MDYALHMRRVAVCPQLNSVVGDVVSWCYVSKTAAEIVDIFCMSGSY